MGKEIFSINNIFKMIVESDMEQYRANTFWTKEPETIRWIQSFKPPIIFFDIGANVGVYTLYCASIHPTSVVYAFEPVKANYLRLIENIRLNHLINVIPIWGAVGKKVGMTLLEGGSDVVGGSGVQIQESGDIIDVQNTHYVIVVTIDSIISMRLSNAPSYIKIDIDGRESDVISGMSNTLASSPPRSILVECADPVVKAKESEWLSTFGYTTDHYLNTMTPHSRERRMREGIQCENVIFVRKP